MQYVQKSIGVLRDEGIRPFFEKSLQKIARMFFLTNEAIWFKKDLNDWVVTGEPDLPIEISFSSQDRIVQWLRKNSASFPWICSEREIEVGRSEHHIYPYATYEGEIIGYFKIAFRRVYIRDYDMVIQLPPGTAFIYDTFTLPEYRGKRIGFFLLTAITRYLKSQSYRKLWCHIPAWNGASLNLYRKAGFEEVSPIRFVRLLKWKLFNLNPEEMMLRESLRYE